MTWVLLICFMGNEYHIEMDGKDWCIEGVAFLADGFSLFSLVVHHSFLDDLHNRYTFSCLWHDYVSLSSFSH